MRILLAIEPAPRALLDGFPHTVRQAEDLERMAPGCLILAVHLVVPAMVLLRRLVARGRRDGVVMSCGLDP